MREYRLRQDIERCDIDGFFLPMGVEAEGLPRPAEGYTLEYTPGEDDEPDSYVFHVVVSHEDVRSVLHPAFSLLPDVVFPVIEVGSRDAYRSVDVFSAPEAISKREFLEIWSEYEPFLLEDAAIGAGANADEPFVEIFMDAWKGVAIHVPVEQRSVVETMLIGLGLREVPETWPADIEREALEASHVRDVLEIVDDQSPDLDELLLQLRESWGLDLDVDRDLNIDEGGRQLGYTLWHAVVVIEPLDGQGVRGAYLSVWVTASSLGQVEELIEATLATMPQWRFQSIYAMDRVAYDERPEELGELPPRRAAPAVHLVNLDIWGDDDAPRPEGP